MILRTSKGEVYLIFLQPSVILFIFLSTCYIIAIDVREKWRVLLLGPSGRKVSDGLELTIGGERTVKTHMDEMGIFNAPPTHTR